MIKATLASGNIPVSYTHLDVYKRQTLEVINRIAEAIGVEPWELFTKSTDKGNIAGYIEIDGVIHKISSKEDIKKIAEQLNIER